MQSINTTSRSKSRAVKCVLVRMVSGNTQAIEVETGTTPSDILRHLGLTDDYEISVGNVVLGSRDPIYGRIEDGQSINLTARVDAGHASRTGA